MKQFRTITYSIGILAFLVFLFMQTLFALGYQNVLRLGLDGTPLLLIYLGGTCIYGISFLLKRFPRFMLYPVKVTPENMLFQATLAKLVLALLEFFSMVLFFCLQYGCYQKLTAQESAMIIRVFIFLLTGCIVLTLGIYLLIARRAKKKENE